jgi:hypothetical protein
MAAEALSLRWPQHFGIKIEAVLTTWSGKPCIMSDHMPIGKLSEEEVRCIQEMRQRKARDNFVRVPFPQHSVPAEADVVRLSGVTILQLSICVQGSTIA